MSGTNLTTFPVTVHEFLPTPSSSSSSKKLTHIYEYGIHDHSSSSTSKEEPKNALVFIGGLGDGPYGVPYIRHITAALSSSSSSEGSSSLSLSYSVFEIRLSSAYSGWGISSLAQDVEEISYVVSYLKTRLHKTRVVLMGHSTGCQDCMAYLHRLDVQERRRLAEGEGEDSEEKIPEIDAAILQGPVSDREAFGMTMSEEDMEESRNLAGRMIFEGKQDEYMPRDKLPVEMRGTPVTAYRWNSLARRQGDDDFFSSDFSDTQAGCVWNPLSKPVLIVPSAEDEWVPKSIDVNGLLRYWKGFCRPGVFSELSGLIPGANHRVDNIEGREWLADRVLRFLGEVDKGIEIGDFK